MSLFLKESDVRQLLTMPLAIEAVDEAHRELALGRAIVHKPANLILDEPTRGLDIFAVRLLRELLKRLRAEGLCILMSSHIMAEVAELSDAITLIAHGRTVTTGTPAEICARAGVTTLEDAIVALSVSTPERTAA